MSPFVRPLVVAVLAVGGAGAWPAEARAHALVVTVSLGPQHPDRIRVEAGYETDDPAAGARVILVDDSDTEIGRGATDETGVCFLPRPPAGLYKVVVNDGTGHRESVFLTVPADEATSAAAGTDRRNHWVMAGVGLFTIAGLTFAARRAAKRETHLPAAP